VSTAGGFAVGRRRWDCDADVSRSGMLAAIDPRVRGEVSAIFAWLAARAEA
jgi:hypothetical protein